MTWKRCTIVEAEVAAEGRRGVVVSASFSLNITDDAPTLSDGNNEFGSLTLPKFDVVDNADTEENCRSIDAATKRPVERLLGRVGYVDFVMVVRVRRLLWFVGGSRIGSSQGIRSSPQRIPTCPSTG